MKLLLDQGLPRSTAELLRKEGLDAVHAGECGLSTVSDEAILEAGRAESRSIITLDSDFHTILALQEAAGPSVVRVRWEGLRAPEMAQLIRRVLELCGDELLSGAVVSFKEGRVRLRRLPMIGESSAGASE